MDCHETRKRLDAWVDGEVPTAEALRITRHLDACQACRRHGETLRRLAEALDGLPPVTAPAGLSRRTLQAFRQGIHRPGMIEWWHGLGLAMRSAVCGAALAGLLCGAVMGTRLAAFSPDGGAGPYPTLYASEGFYP
jgi:anti-sigma factor RsiW